MEKIKIAHLYYDLMNLYGENGNIMALEKGFNDQDMYTETSNLTIGDKIDFNKYDIYYMGCGSEENQSLVIEDILKYKDKIKNAIENNKETIVLVNSGNYDAIIKEEPKYINKVKILDNIEIAKRIENVSTGIDITKDTFIIYLSGIDTRRNKLPAKSLSDANIILVINPIYKKILMINTPRDYYINLHEINLKDKDTITVNDLPTNAIYTITELNSDGYYVEYCTIRDNNTCTLKEGKEIQNGVIGEANTVSVKFVNYASVIMPETGGCGTTIMVITGSILMIGSVIYIYQDFKNKKVSN